MGANIDIENLAVNTVSSIFSKTGYLVSYIPTKDRGPSFDGCVIVYGHKGSNHDKKDMIGRVDVQVKGRILMAPEVDLSSYPLEVDDLQNYLNAGGAMLFIVSFDSDGNNEAVYYSQLLPFDLKRLLKSCRDGQAKKSVPLLRLPFDKDDISDIFINFIRNYKLQRAFVESSFEMDEENKNVFGKMFFGFTTINNLAVQSNEVPFKYLFSHGTYLYKDIGHGFSIPVDYIERIDSASREADANISIGNIMFYDKLTYIVHKEYEEIVFGKSNHIILDAERKVKEYKYELTGSLIERIRDEHFFIDLYTNNYFKLDNVEMVLDLSTNNKEKKIDIKKVQEHLDWLIKINETLEKIHAQDTLRSEQLSKADEMSLRLLVEGVLEKKHVKLNLKESSLGTLTIGNLNLLICALCRNDDEGFDLFSYYDAPIVLKGFMNEEEFVCPHFVALTKSELSDSSNLDLPYIYKKVTEARVSQGYICHVTLFLLEIIKAFDETGRDELYTYAIKLCSWLKKCDPNNDTHVINYYQIKKRKKPLSPRALSIVRRISMESNEAMIRIGAFLLLDEQQSAKEIYKNLSDADREVFNNYPICRFGQSLFE